MKVSGNKSFGTEKFQATRPLDYIYDPLFTFSGPKDYYKNANDSYKASSSFSVQPIFNSMFSDMARYPRANIVLRPSHQVPNTIDTSYKGKLKAISQEKTVTAEVTGTDRYKYFRRPVTEAQAGAGVTAIGSRFPLLGTDSVTNLGITAPPTTAQKLMERSAKHSATTQVRSVQTDFRESEAQTQPWTPPFIIRGDTTPEVLHLNQLSWRNGLPPGQHEVEFVERMRMKQAWEASLPPLDSKANTKKRFKLIAEMEKSDWEFREKELDAINEERMKKAAQVMEQHVLINRTRLGYRMKFLEDDINKRKEKKLGMIHRETERALRKLCMKEKGYNPKYHKKNIVDEHLQYTSDLYAPMKRFGTSFKNSHEILAEKHITIDQRDLVTLASEVQYQPTFDYNRLSQPKKQTELCVRETRWTMENLVKLHQDLQTLRAKESKKIDMFYTQAVEQVHKPSKMHEVTSVPLTHETQERLYQAAVLIQRVIQGRAMQTQMQIGRARWMEVMEELKSAGSLTGEQLPVVDSQKDRLNQDIRLNGEVEYIVGMSVGKTVGQTLDLLAAELVWLKHEGSAERRAVQAEVERWRREVPEAGRRQKEITRREEHNLMFAELLEAYQETINEFLVDLLTNAREQEAKSQAFEYAKEMALLAEAEQLIQEEEAEEEPVSADLLFEMIAPSGLRELTRACMLILKQKYDEARQQLVQSGRTEPLEQADSICQDTLISSTATYVYSEAWSSHKGSSDLMDMAASDEGAATSSPKGECGLPLARFGLTQPAAPEDRLLARVIRDMCYLAGALLQTAAKILNKALRLSNIPQESFEEALSRTMRIVNEAREEITQLILPKLKGEPESKQSSCIAYEEIRAEATQIVDDILNKAKERIASSRERKMETIKIPRIIIESDIQTQANDLVENIIKEAQHQIFKTVAEDFLTDLMKEARSRVEQVTGEWHRE